MGDQAGSAPEGLRQLAERIRDPFFTKAFAADPDAALTRAGIPRETIDERILSALAELSHEELRALARIGRVLEEAGEPGGVDRYVTMKMV
jgi:hypothetical protein